MFNKIDVNQNGKIEKAEFMLIAGDRDQVLSRTNVEQLFIAFDVD